MPIVSTKMIVPNSWWRHVSCNGLCKVIGLARDWTKGKTSDPSVVYIGSELCTTTIKDWCENATFIGMSKACSATFFKPHEMFAIELPGRTTHYCPDRYYVVGGSCRLDRDGRLSWCGGHGIYQFLDADKFELVRSSE
jgi:hypothetical protein